MDGRRASQVNESDLSYEIFPDAPMQLIGVDPATDELVVTPEARAALAALGPGKLCVVGVTGMYRTGKSSLLNFMRHGRHAGGGVRRDSNTARDGDSEALGLSGNSSISRNDSSSPEGAASGMSGFGVSHTVERGTRGLWIWGRPHRAILESGEECWVLDLDSEGIGGIDSDEKHDARIFSLATLLCSTIIYNSLGTIDGNAIAALSFITQLAKHIHVNPPSKDDKDDDNGAEGQDLEFSRFFPSFLWVLRDFQLDLEDSSGHSITADEYLERSLRAQPGFDSSTLEQNRIRQMVGTYFPSRSCVTLVRPLMDEERLQDIHHVRYGELRQEFRDGLEVLRNRVYLHHLRPKVVNSVAVNGKSFLALCDHYVQAIGSGSVPTISSAWQDAMRVECRDAVDKAVNHYDELAARSAAARAFAPVGTSALADLHVSFLRESIDLYLTRAGGPEALSHRLSLEQLLSARLHGLSKENFERSQAMCREAIQYLYSQMIVPKLEKPGEEENHAADGGSNGSNAYTRTERPLHSLQEDLRELAVHYNSKAPKATGPAKSAVLAEFFARDVMEAFASVAGQVNIHHEGKVAKLSRQLEESRANEAFNTSRREVEEQALEAASVEVLKVRAEKLQVHSHLTFVEAELQLCRADLMKCREQNVVLEAELEVCKGLVASQGTRVQVKPAPEFDALDFTKTASDSLVRIYIFFSGLVWASYMLYCHLFNNITQGTGGIPTGTLGPTWLRVLFEVSGVSINEETSFSTHTVQNWSLGRDAALPWSSFANKFSFGFIPIAASDSSEVLTSFEVSVPQPSFAFTLGRAISFCVAISIVAVASVHGVVDVPAFNLGVAACMNIVFYARVWWYPEMRHHILVLICAPSIPYLAMPSILGLHKAIRRLSRPREEQQEEIRTISDIIGNSWESISPRKWRRVWKERAIEGNGVNDDMEHVVASMPMSPPAAATAAATSYGQMKTPTK